MDYKQIDSIVRDHIDEFKDSISKMEYYDATTDMAYDLKLRYIIGGIIEVYEKHRGERL